MIRKVLFAVLSWSIVAGPSGCLMMTTGCVGGLKSSLTNNGSYFLKVGTDIEVGTRTSRTDATATVDSTSSLTKPIPPSNLTDEWAMGVDEALQAQGETLARIEALIPKP